MTRRLPALAIVLAATTLVSSCSTFDSGSAARVGGTEIDGDALRFLLSDPTAEAATGDGDESGLVGDDARAQLTTLIKTRVGEQIAAAYGVDLTAMRTAVRPQIEADLSADAKQTWDDLDESSRNLLIDYGNVATALGTAPAAAPGSLEELYTDPEHTGHFCLRIIVTDDEATIQDAVRRLAAGEAFADVAELVSPGSEGGVASDSAGLACIRLDQFNFTAMQPELAGALLTSSPGVPSDVIELQGDGGRQWIILLQRPFDEIKDALTAAVGQAPALAAYYGALATSDVWVASAYGRWDPVRQSVVPLT